MKILNSCESIQIFGGKSFGGFPLFCFPEQIIGGHTKVVGDFIKSLSLWDGSFIPIGYISVRKREVFYHLRDAYSSLFAQRFYVVDKCTHSNLHNSISMELLILYKYSI